MLFIFNANGDVLDYVPENIYQGSNNANTIYVVAPLSSANQVLAHVTLPNGKIVSPIYATNQDNLTLLDTVVLDNTTYSIWGCKISKVVTAIAGIVSISFEFINETQEISTAATNFPILEGNPPAQPFDLTTETTLQDILAYISQFITNQDSKFESLKADIEQDFSNLETEVQNNFNELSEEILARQEILEENISQEVKKNSSDIRSIYNILEIKDILAYETIPITTNARVTANGENIVDGAEVELKAVKGNTVKSNNLFNSDLLLGASGWTENDGVYSGQTAQLASKYNQDMGGFLKVNAGEQVTVSFVGKNANAQISTLAIGFVYTDGTTADQSFIDTTAYTKYSITSSLGKKVDYIYFSYYSNDTIYLKDFCVSFGTNDTYEPYKESIIELPEVVDTGLGVTVNFENKVITESYAELTATGTEAVKFLTQTNKGYVYAINFSTANNPSHYKIDRNLVSDVYTHFSFVNPKRGVSDLPLWGAKWNGGGLQFDFCTSFATLDEFRAWVKSLYDSGNPLKVRYITRDIQNEIPFNEQQSLVNNYYSGYDKGMETIIGNSNSESVNNTVELEYLTITE